MSYVMENKIKPDTERWVEERMASLAAPDDWEPDASLARMRLNGRMSARRPTFARVWMLRVATVALVLVMIFAIPTTRALTQQLWWWVTMQKVEVVQADFQKWRGVWLVPQMEEKQLKEGEEGPPMPPAVDFTEAARSAGFTPRLPRAGAAPGDPVLMVFNDPMVWSTTLNVANMEASLRQAGVYDQPIPKEWDGAQMSLTTRSAISAVWNRGEMGLFQHPPITLSAPAGFDITVYWMAAMRAAGIPREQAQRLAERMRANPALLLGIAPNNKKSIREVNLRSGLATLIETRGERRGGGPYPTDFWESIRRFFEDIFDLRKGGRQVLLIWGVEDRVYYLTAMSAEQAITAANSIE